MGTVQYRMIGLTAASNGSLTERLSKAINILGPGTCIFILALIILVVFLIVYLPSHKMVKINNTNKNDSGMDRVISQIVEQEELIGDCELVAVITAAIQASMGETAPVGGFIVRSIHKVNTRKRLNA